MKTNKLFLTLALGFLVAVAGCKKDDKNDSGETITSAEDNAQIDNEFTAMYEASDDVAQTNGKTQKTGNAVLPGGAILTFSDSLFTDGDGVEFSIDYGPLGSSAPKGLLCNDGRYRAGKINISMTKRWNETGCVLTIDVPVANNYYAGDGTNMVQFSGSRTITRVDDATWNLSVTNGQAITSGGTLTWASSGTITRTYDAGLGLYGDIYTVTGSGNGTNRNGVPYTVSITTPLKKKVEFPCASTFIKGVIEITNTGSSKKIVVDYDPYANEACDRVARATINGKNYTFLVN